MTLREHIDQLQNFAKENPDCLEMTVITSKDDEGNGYNEIRFSPSKGSFDGDDFNQEGEPNAVCVN